MAWRTSPSCASSPASRSSRRPTPGRRAAPWRRRWNLPGPVYYRLGKDDKAVVPGLDGRFELGKLQRLREGADLLVIAMGSVATEAAAAAQELAARGVSCSLVIVAQRQPRARG